MIEQIEQRFLEIAKISIDLSKYPLSKSDKGTQVLTDKDKSNTFGEVFTPLWLVDEMLERVDIESWKDQDNITLDLCAGYGQFTIRMLRKKTYELGEKFDLEKFLTNTHFFNELQIDSCHKLLMIFGTDINLFIGDARTLSLIEEGTKGIWLFDEENKYWCDITKEVKHIYTEDKTTFVGDFVEMFASRSERKLESLGMEW